LGFLIISPKKSIYNLKETNTLWTKIEFSSKLDVYCWCLLFFSSNTLTL